MGNITLKSHAPHVDNRNNPEKAKVVLTLKIPSLKNKQVTIERNVKDALSPKITPATQEILEVFRQLENHPEFVLSRREIIAYVLAQPGDRAREIQALLRLEQVGELRSVLVKISNSCDKDRTVLKKTSMHSGDRLEQALEISELTTKKLLEAVNVRRTVLRLDPIKILTSTTPLDDGLKTGTKSATNLKVNKTQATNDFGQIRKLLPQLTSNKMNDECADLYAQIKTLSSDPAATDSVSREKFLRTAITLITDESNCPVCDTEWKISELCDLIEKKLKKYEETTKTRTVLEKRIGTIVDLLEKLDSILESVEKCAKILATEYVANLSRYRERLALIMKSLKGFLPLTATLSSIKKLTAVPSSVMEALRIIEARVKAVPDPTEQDAAKYYLVLCQDRLETYREAKRNAKQAGEHADLAKTVHDVYVTESNKVLKGVYKQVEDEFGKFYCFINRADEVDFTAHLTPSMGKLGFDVEFYGRGHFPPGAYHSEGHQDAMGLCLYLALMKRLQGENFKIAVLDDVLMSVDTDHRRDVCNLLAKYFPNTQFILTTHDEVWLKHMGSVGLIDSEQSIRFSNWTPDHGPTEWSSRDIWAEIDFALGKNDVQVAASKLRHYLEYISKEVCNNLRAPVEFKSDGQYDLGDVLPPAAKQFTKLLELGRVAAESWGQIKEAKAIKQREEELAKFRKASFDDQWQINPAIHYNEWADLAPKDFKPVVTVFRDLILKFSCEEPECGLFYLAGTRPKTKDVLKCECGNTNINIKKKATKTK